MAGIFGRQNPESDFASASNTNNAAGASTSNINGTTNERQNPHMSTMNGMRARSTTFRTGNGNIVSVINIGVPTDHPLADSGSMAGPSGLANVQVGGISMPAP
jgi:hypothetical protein